MRTETQPHSYSPPHWDTDNFKGEIPLQQRCGAARRMLIQPEELIVRKYLKSCSGYMVRALDVHHSKTGETFLGVFANSVDMAQVSA